MATHNNTSKPCQFLPLPSTDFIRILYLTPGSGSDQLSGSLFRVGLGANAHYEALSYEWGSPDKTRLLHLQVDSDDEPTTAVIRITESLYEALCDLRCEPPDNTARAVWADAICINQDDAEEVAQQVSIMGQIYRTASRVVTYIGPDRDGAGALAVQFAQELANFDRRQYHKHPRMRKILQRFTKPADDPRQRPPSDSRWAALRSLLSRGWPSRCWCAHEFLVNKNLLLMCGRVNIHDWSILMTVVLMVFRRELPASLVPGAHEDPRGVGECIQRLGEMRSSLVIYQLQSDLSSLLLKTHAFRASDPRDKVYSVLGLAREYQLHHNDHLAAMPLPEVSYTRSAEDLYIEVASQIFETCQDMRLLVHNLPIKTLTSLPSWVPDWSTWVYGTGAVVFDLIYNACGPATTPKLHVVRERNMLQIVGCLVDRINRVGSGPIGPHYRRTSPDDVAPRRKWLASQQEELVRFLSADRYPDGKTQDLQTALWKTLIGNMTFSGHAAGDDEDSRSYMEYRTCFDAHIEEFHHLDGKHRDMANRFVDAVRRKSRSRRLATTERGYLAAVPEKAEVGDWVCMFHGARNLFVVRESIGSSTDSVEEDSFVFLGPAYVHGLMQGEVLEAEWYRERTISLA
ncbi:ankyrin and HET domain-containing protein [Apodospora peruviana]|uniref:Ankyrin and HET domain-containing protein n=1 Tax=Apodospora peruviana TaxID=516989 RepID=A0AAE0I3V8_9PEZI|nr:ankyrin and HET domain-containing protein [Apodospora peruviana]